MRKSRRMDRMLAVVKGVGIAAAVTLAGMVLMTIAVWRLDVSDEMIVMLNQLLKVLAVALGTFAAVGRGGESGFLTGTLIGTLYIVLGYSMYAALGGAVTLSGMMGEWTIGAAAGACTGAVAVNLPRTKRA